MKVTTKERMVQLSSSIDAFQSVLCSYLETAHPELLSERVSKVSSLTVADVLSGIHRITEKIATADPHYFADLEIGYTEDTFPVESY